MSAKFALQLKPRNRGNDCWILNKTFKVRNATLHWWRGNTSCDQIWPSAFIWTLDSDSNHPAFHQLTQCNMVASLKACESIAMGGKAYSSVPNPLLTNQVAGAEKLSVNLDSACQQDKMWTTWTLPCVHSSRRQYSRDRKHGLHIVTLDYNNSSEVSVKGMNDTLRWPVWQFAEKECCCHWKERLGISDVYSALLTKVCTKQPCTHVISSVKTWLTWTKKSQTTLELINIRLNFITRGTCEVHNNIAFYSVSKRNVIKENRKFILLWIFNIWKENVIEHQKQCIYNLLIIILPSSSLGKDVCHMYSICIKTRFMHYKQFKTFTS